MWSLAVLGSWAWSISEGANSWHNLVQQDDLRLGRQRAGHIDQRLLDDGQVRFLRPRDGAGPKPVEKPLPLAAVRSRRSNPAFVTLSIAVMSGKGAALWKISAMPRRAAATGWRCARRSPEPPRR